MELTRCSPADYGQIVTEIVDFWDSDRTLVLHHPMFIHEFGDTAFVIKDGERVLAYLFGVFSQTEPVAYVHLVAVRAEARREGLARRLYEAFVAKAQERNCRYLKAITTPTNRTSIVFHRSLGMELLGEPGAEGVPVIRDYSGPGQDRVVFLREL